MLTFKNYLSEARETTDLNIEKAVELFKSEYSESLKLFGTSFNNGSFLYRGANPSSSKSPIDLVAPASQKRKPLPGGEYYTAMLSTNPENADWPSRYYSVFCSTNKNVAYGWAGKKARGRVYALFPKNGSKLAFANTSDFWGVRNPAFKYNGAAITMSSVDMYFSDLHKNCGIEEFAPSSLDSKKVFDIMNKHKDMIENNKITMSEEDKLGFMEKYGVISHCKNTKGFLELSSLESMKCILTTVNNSPDVMTIGSGMECWFEGEYMAVLDDEIYRLIVDLKSNKLLPENYEV